MSVEDTEVGRLRRVEGVGTKGFGRVYIVDIRSILQDDRLSGLYSDIREAIMLVVVGVNVTDDGDRVAHRIDGIVADVDKFDGKRGGGIHPKRHRISHTRLILLDLYFGELEHTEVSLLADIESGIGIERVGREGISSPDSGVAVGACIPIDLRVDLRAGIVDVRSPGLQSAVGGNDGRHAIVGVDADAVGSREMVVGCHIEQAGIVGGVGIDRRGEPSVETIGGVACSNCRERDGGIGIEDDGIEGRNGAVDNDVARCTRSENTRSCAARIGELDASGTCRRVESVDTAVLDDNAKRRRVGSDTIFVVGLDKFDDLEIIGQSRELECTNTGGRSVAQSSIDIVGDFGKGNTVSLDILAIGAQVGKGAVKVGRVHILRVAVGGAVSLPVGEREAVDAVVFVQQGT